MRNLLIKNLVLPFLTGSLFSLFILMAFRDQNVLPGKNKTFQQQWKIENADFNSYLRSI